MRSVFWDYDNNTVKLIDQRLLPFEFVIVEFKDYRDIARAISEMYVRGAPAIGATAAFGMALVAFQSSATNIGQLGDLLEEAAKSLKAARPTAVNLSWAVNRQLSLFRSLTSSSVSDIAMELLESAQKIADDDIKTNRRIGDYGSELLQDGDKVLHHCNTGALATVGWGTALGVIFTAHEQKKDIHVLVNETRPRLQGARLTAWELEQRKIPFDLIADNAAGHFMRTGEVDIVLVGSDRTAANGDVANKIGTYQLAVLAKENGIPFYPVVPTSTIDLELDSGDLIPIEERSIAEIVNVNDRPIAPEGTTARNPAFDVTPNQYVTGFVTEVGIIYPPFRKSLRAAVTRSIDSS